MISRLPPSTQALYSELLELCRRRPGGGDRTVSGAGQRPRPARAAFHKLWTSGEQTVAQASKAAKDLAQAAALLEVLLEDRPGDLAPAWRSLAPHAARKAAVERMATRLPAPTSRGARRAGGCRSAVGYEAADRPRTNTRHRRAPSRGRQRLDPFERAEEMMRETETSRRVGAWTAVVAGALLATAAGAQDVAEVSPGTSVVKHEDRHVRVLEVRIGKGVEVGMHSHPERVIYVIKGGTLRMTAPDGTSRDITVTAGQTLALPPETHAVKNVGKTELHAIETELLDAGERSATLTPFERSELVAMLERSRDRLAAVIARADGDLWSTRPAEGKWSVAEVVEHLGTAETMLFGLIEGALAAPADPDWRNVDRSPTVRELMDNLLDRSQKFNAPEPLQPKGGLSRAELVARFFGAREVTIDFVRRTDAALHAHTAQAPPGKMSGHQCLVLMVGHTLRHTAQAEEALAMLAAR